MKFELDFDPQKADAVQPQTAALILRDAARRVENGETAGDISHEGERWGSFVYGPASETV